MATLSHEAFRRIIESFGGCHEYFTEMINASSLLNNGPWERFYLINETAPEKIVWQLTGSETEKIPEAVSVVCEKGGIGVDLNMGCSAPQIYRTGAGISWMIKPVAETEALVSKTKKALEQCESKYGRHFRLSVKCRLGDDNFTEEGFLNFCSMLYNNGVELITLHPRTKKERTTRTLPRYEFAQKLCTSFPGLKVYLNGCIKDSESASYALSKAPSVSGIMIATQAAVKPWIFSQLDNKLNGTELKVKEIDRMKVALDFIDFLEKYQPEEFYKTRLQRFFAYYCQQFSFGHRFASLVMNYKGLEEARTQVKEYFERNPDQRILVL